MKSHERIYHRLPGRGLTRHSLWLAADHLLDVDKRAFSETYKRFYFKDIQAIMTQRTASARVIEIVLLVLLFGLIALMIATGADRETVLGWMIIFGMLGLGLIVNRILGPTCACYIVTAVQQTKLPSASRMRTAQKVLRIVRPLIEQAQQTPVV